MRLSEVYKSIQGEGPNVGRPTIFVRFGGCNLRCPLWPCDTPYAVDPKIYRSEWKKLTPEEVFIEIVSLMPEDDKGFNVCLTGGEPMLQPNDELTKLVATLAGNGYDVEMFSNGTLEYVHSVYSNVDTVVMDWKLPGSGERWDDPVRIKNSRKLNWKDAVKFTIADEIDYERAKRIEDTYLDGQVPVYAGVVWGKLENQQLVEWMLEDGRNWRLNVQVHNHVWDRTKRGI